MIDSEMFELLARVDYEGNYYGSLSTETPEYQLLRKLENLGFVRYCPYPEEFWVILPSGKDLLKDYIDNSLKRLS
jgi:hypothetical protein